MKEFSMQNVIDYKGSFHTRGSKVSFDSYFNFFPTRFISKFKLLNLKLFQHDESYMNLVMGFMPSTAKRVVNHYTNQQQPVPLLLVKIYAYQMFRALSYIHSCGVCHRDIKPQNLLIDPETHVLKICDFGSAKKLEKDTVSTSYITSRFYRAPELIFGATDYTFSIDMWSAGCVLAELLVGQPIFPGESGVDQLVEIIKVLGSPDQDDITSMNPNYQECKLPAIPARSWKDILRRDSPKTAETLLASILMYRPVSRVFPMKALLHDFFAELRLEETTLPNGDPLPDLLNFSKEELQTLDEEDK